MRTTLELDDDLVAAAKQLAKEQGKTLGRTISDLARESLAAKEPVKIRNGFRLITPILGVPRPSLEQINRWRDEEE